MTGHRQREAAFPYNEAMKKVLVRLRSYYENEATSTEKKVLEFILNHPRQTSVMDIRTLSAQGHCSPSTLMRICQKNGFEGYRELRDSLLQEIGFRQTAATILQKANDHSLARKLLLQHVHALEQTYELLDQAVLDQVVNCILQAPIVHLYGIGASYLVMEDLQLKLIRISKPCLLFHDLHLQYVDACNAPENALAIVASYSGQTTEMIELTRKLKERQVNVVLISQD